MYTMQLVAISRQFEAEVVPVLAETNGCARLRIKVVIVPSSNYEKSCFGF